MGLLIIEKTSIGPRIETMVTLGRTHFPLGERKGKNYHHHSLNQINPMILS